MAGTGRSGFAPRFNPKTTKGEKRKRNVTFWANLNTNQESTYEKLDQNVLEHDENINNLEKEQNEKNSGDKNVEEKTDRSPEAKRK